MAKISLQNIRKVYPGGVEVVPKLNLEIADKEFVVLVGPSGCLDDDGAQLSSGNVGKSAAELADGGTACRCDNNFLHVNSLLICVYIGGF